MSDKWLRWENGRIKPILFNTEMVRAIMDGRKTVTRRVVNPQPKAKLAYARAGQNHGKWMYPGENTWKFLNDESFRLPEGLTNDFKERKKVWMASYHPDDILYVRETWADASALAMERNYIYKASDEETLKTNGIEVRWRPSIHMPREAARLFLRVKDVRVERLRPMGLDEFEEEGFSTIAGLWDTTAMFADLWDSTIKKSEIPIYGWNADPWVWVIEFERISREEAAE